MQKEKSKSENTKGVANRGAVRCAIYARSASDMFRATAIRDQIKRVSLTFLAMRDELYLASLREKVQRGQQGRLLSGYIAGGRCYGYKNVALEDPTRPSNYGRPYIIGVRREILPEQAEIVRRIFGMYASGHTLSKVAHSLNAERVPAPHSHSENVWRSSTVASILRNQHYRGVIMWNRTQKTRNPETGRCKTLVRPEAQWVRIERPECRIVSEEMCKQVDAERQRRRTSRKSFRWGSTKPLKKGARNSANVQLVCFNNFYRTQNHYKGRSWPVPDFQCSSVELDSTMTIRSE